MKQNPTGREAAKYWVVAPMEVDAPNKLFATALEYDRQHGTIAIGWYCDSSTLQDISKLTDFEEFQAEIRKHQSNWGLIVQKTIWDFHCEIQVGDTVIARRGSNEIIGIGIVKKTAYYNFAKGIKRISPSSPIPEKLQKYIKPRFVEVCWIITGSFSVHLKLKRGRILEEITESHYQKLLEMLKEALKDIPDLNAHKTLKIKGEATRQKHQPERKRIWGQRPRSSSSEPNYYIGIDLGTTNSLMAWGSINPRTNQLEPKIVPINMMTASHATQKKPLLPSYIYFQEGRPPNVGEYAKKMLKVAPDRVVESIKHLVGAQNELEIDGTFYTPVQFLALILIHLAASAKSHFGFIPDNAIITVPAYFNTKMRDETIKAAELAGFRITDNNGNPRAILLDQPYAVLYDRINQEIREEVEASLSESEKSKIVLIFDLGGGALEVSLHRVSHKKKQNEPDITPIARSYNQIGGNSFDKLLADHLRNTFYKKFFKPDLDSFKVSQFNNAFRQYAEQAKIDLSKQIAFEKKVGEWDPNKPPDTVTIPPIVGRPVGDEAFELYEGFSLGKYEEIIAPCLASHLTLEDVNKLDTDNLANDNIIYPILDVLRKGRDRMNKSGQLKEDWEQKFPQVDVVLLNGGMTKLHTIQERLKTFFKSTQFESVQIVPSSEGAIARGATVFHYNSEQQKLKPPPRIMQEKIKIEIASEKPRHFVESRAQNHFYWRFSVKAGVSLPTTQSKPFDLSMQVGATSAKLTVYRMIPNSSKFFQEKKVVQEFQFGRPLKKKDLPVSILMGINERGELNVEAHPKDNPDEKFTVTVNLEALWQERFIQPKVGELGHLNINAELKELTTNFNRLEQTKNLDIRRRIFNRIKTQEDRIVQSTNAEDFVAPLCDIISSFDNFGKMRVMILLGNLTATCSYTDPLHDICEVAMKLTSSQEIEANDQTYVNNVVRYAVEAIGKTRLFVAKSSLFDLLNLDEISTIRPVVIRSIGKCCNSIDAIEHLMSFVKPGEDANRIATNWALGKIGRREKENPIPIQQLIPVISYLIEQLETKCHKDIKWSGIYALAEICDRRECANDVVSPRKAGEVILLFVKFLTNHMRDFLSESPSSELSSKLQESTLLAIQMIRGIDLSSEQEGTLQGIREAN